MPLWFIEIVLIFVFCIPILCLLVFFLVAAEIMKYQDAQKEAIRNGENQIPQLHA